MAQQDEFDQLIGSKGLRIARFAFFRDVDVFLLILSNRRIISRPLSAYPSLVSATDIQLTNYTISDSGIHWPLLDVDLSLRGFLMEDAVMGLRAENSRLAA
ncbi:hypothetical protein AWR27_21775 [Spirosoma montaniterrae]|uniref:DUF2442 domain-containing protein n=2 Tax=Spirosoma montaniterrae TaxID=1178516 RepID=A0A1P9X4V2_9BACT|nr:hypothetical protein AWR27_21775 [Spirosoma montaniterrae]